MASPDKSKGKFLARVFYTALFKFPIYSILVTKKFKAFKKLYQLQAQIPIKLVIP